MVVPCQLTKIWKNKVEVNLTVVQILIEAANVTKQVDNKAVLIGSNYVGIKPLGAIKCWDKTSNFYKDIPCPKIVLAYNKNMGGVDLQIC